MIAQQSLVICFTRRPRFLWKRINSWLPSFKFHWQLCCEECDTGGRTIQSCSTNRHIFMAKMFTEKWTYYWGPGSFIKAALILLLTRVFFVLEHEQAITIFMQHKEKTDWDRMVSKKNNLTSSHSVCLFLCQNQQRFQWRGLLSSKHPGNQAAAMQPQECIATVANTRR